MKESKHILVVASLFVILVAAMIGIFSLLGFSPSVGLEEDPSRMFWVLGIVAFAAVTMFVMLKAGEIKSSSRK